MKKGFDFPPLNPDTADKNKFSQITHTALYKPQKFNVELNDVNSFASFELPDNYIFPGDKKISKFPIIAIEGDANEYALWLRGHPEIDRRVPPIYADFLITHTYNEHHYDILVHYSKDFTKFCFKVKLDNKKLLISIVDYEEINDSVVHVTSQIYQDANNQFETSWLKSTSLACAFLVIAVQAYMLYFKPEIVEKIYTPDAPPKEKKPSQTRRRITAEPIKLRKTKIKRIYLSAVDRPPKNVNYRKLSWHVRGHYRHVGKEKKLKYIQPFVCNRGGKKYHKNVRKYVLPDEKEI